MILKYYQGVELEKAGQTIIEFNLSDFDDDMDGDRLALEMISYDELNRVIAEYQAFVDADLVEFVREKDNEDHRLVLGFLTEHGHLAQTALKAGMHWDTDLQDIAVESTIEKYMDQLKRGVTEATYDMIASFKDPRLKPLVNAAMKHRMRATQNVGGYWYV